MIPAPPPRHVALTFDDGPDPVWTPAVLDALAVADVRATFFVIAPLAAAHPALVARTLTEGHAVELHCHDHVRHSELTDVAIDEDTERALDLLAGLGVRPTLWRTPWGVMTEHTRVVAERHGLALVHWTTDTEDWAGHDVQTMLARVTPDLVPGAIVLAHDGLGPGATRGGCAATVDLIDPLVWRARARGLECRRLDAATVAAA